MHQAEIHDNQIGDRTTTDTGPRRNGWMTTLKTGALAIVPCCALVLAIFVLKLDPQRWLAAGVFAAATFALIPTLGNLRRRGRRPWRDP